jgi:hypothetical protein
MVRSACLGVLSAAVLVATMSLAPTGLAAPAGAVAGPTVLVHGRLLVVPAETPGGSTSYGVALADGDIVAVRGRFGADARTGAVFQGRLELPRGVVASMRARGLSGSGAALRLVDRRSLTLDVVGTPSVVAPAGTSAAVTPTAHQQYVAALDNKGGALGQDDTTLLGHVSTVGGYWQGESGGAMSVTVPGTVKHYDSSLTTTDCGLGSDFFNVVQEAAGKFPGINWMSGTDQLVVFVAPGCSSGSVVGEGTLGSTFASGGALIVKAGSAIEGTYGHETGHNYGFGHANARYAGSSLEYYGIYDVMGFALGGGVNQLTALSTPFRVFQGITDPGEIQDVDLGNGLSAVHATVTIEPRSDDTGLRSIRVKDPDTGENLYLDYRSGTGIDAGSAYAGGAGLSSPKGNIWYGTGVTISAARATGGNDTLVLDGLGHTYLPAGGTWSDASGLLTVTVTSIGAAGASVAVDYSPPQAFTTVGTPVIGGSVQVGGSVTLDTGTWSPAPSTTQVAWTADGSPVAALAGQTSFTPGPSLVGKQLVASVTARKPGYQTTTVQSAPVTVTPGTISGTSNPTVSGTDQVGFTLHATTGAWGTVLSTVASAYQWQRDGVDVNGATGPDYQVRAADVGATLRVVQRLTATGYQPTTLTSADTGTVPDPVIDPSPVPTVVGTPQVGSPLSVQAGTWMTGVALGYQWYVGGVAVSGATGTTYRPSASDLGKTVRVEVTGTRTDYPAVTRASSETAAVATGVLTSARPTIRGTAEVGRTLTARPGAWTPGTTFAYVWYADGKVVKHQTRARLRLTTAQQGHRITVRVTGSLPGYQTVSRTSARTAKVT